MSKIANNNWKNFDHTYGPLPTKANEYMRLEKEIEKMVYNAKQRKAFDEMTGDERATTKSYHITHKRNQLQALETELLNNRYLYRNSDHMATVIRYLFPQYVVKETKPPSPIPAAVPAAAAPAPAPAPAPLKPQNDAWY